MQMLGRPDDFNFEALGIHGQESERRNLTRGQLVEIAVKNGDCRLSETGSIVVNTGKFTGRSPKDKFIVKNGLPSDQNIDWGAINQPIAPEKVQILFQKMLQYAKNKKLFDQDLCVGHHPKYSIAIQVISESAWHSLFARNLFLPQEDQTRYSSPDFTVLDLPGFFAQPEIDGLNSSTFIIIDFERKIVLIGGTAYAGEIKKAVFSIMNKLLPEQGILSMHCSANIGEDQQTALFFGLSGTGKTTLSSDVDRRLIGDDETGWGDDGIFNFEGGCYAKTLGLREENESLIYKASTRFGTILENVVLDPVSRQINFNDSSLTENTRAAYPLDFIGNSVPSGQGDHPKNIFFLSADAFGVLPPIALLTPEQVQQYFLAGFTAKLAGTEQGMQKSPQATFSACFASPFLPLQPKVYAQLLHEKMNQHKTKVWLINTGWSGGRYGVGERIKLAYTRALIRSAIYGELVPGQMIEDPVFHLAIPETCTGVPFEILNPSRTWKNQEDYFFQANQLKELIRQNSLTC